MKYWFNTRTREVEADNDPSRARIHDLLGPYSTRGEAEQALQAAAARTEAWDEEDKAEQEWETGDRDAKDWDNNPLND